MKLKKPTIFFFIFFAIFLAFITALKEIKAQACLCSACSWTCSNINCIGRQAGSWCASGNVKNTCSGSCVTNATCGYCVISCGFSQKDCDDYDGIYDTGLTRWVSTGECTEKKQKEVQYRDYSCSGGDCVYSGHPKYWVDTGENRCKSVGTDCGTDVPCSLTGCSADKCDRIGTGKNYRCESGTYPDCPCNWITTTCSEFCEAGDVCSGGTCSMGPCATPSYYCDTYSGGVCDGHGTVYYCNGVGSCSGSSYDDDSACNGLTCDTPDYYCDTYSGGLCDGHKTSYTCDSNGNCNGTNSDDDSACNGLRCASTDYYCDTHSGGVCDGHKTSYTCDSNGNCNGTNSDDDSACNGFGCGVNCNPACPSQCCTRYCDGSGTCQDCIPPACDCSCDGWTTRSCDYSTCPWYQTGETRTCVPSGCDIELRCACEESCCTSWTNQDCGLGGCGLTEMYQTRDCGTCTYLEYQCIPNYPGCATSSPPIAIISCHPTGCENPVGACTGYTKSNFCLKNESTDPDGVGDIENSIWTIKESTIIKDTSDCNLSGNPLCNWTLPATFGAGNYFGELYVQDRHGFSATTSRSFIILQDTIANFSCSLDNANWWNCETLRPTIDEIVYFLDQSLPSQGAIIIRRSWTFQDGNPASNVDNATNPSTRFQSTGGRTVTLTTTDSAGRIDSQSYIISVSISLPEWKEIPPP